MRTNRVVARQGEAFAMLIRVAAFAVLALGCGGRVAAGDAPSDAASSDGADAVTDALPTLGPGSSAALGWGHGCVVNNGRVRCFGANSNGQLGNGSTADSLLPIDVVGLENVVEVAAAGDTTCARTRAGETHCWGDNRAGEAGVGSEEKIVLRPRRIALGRAARITGGHQNFCALLDDATAWCWGANFSRVLGRDTTEACGIRGSFACGRTPGPVDTTTRFVRIAPSSEHTCAIAVDGRVWCWGRGTDGKVGDGMTTPGPSPPVAISLFATELAAAMSHTCALDRDKSVWCWGANVKGALGLGAVPYTCPWVAPYNAPTPERVNVPAARSIIAGSGHVCAGNDSTLLCWGPNGHGALGVGVRDGVVPECSAAPVPVVALGPVRDLIAGGDTTCAIAEATGQRYCWGYNGGKFGDGTLTDHPSPTPVPW